MKKVVSVLILFFVVNVHILFGVALKQPNLEMNQVLNLGKNYGQSITLKIKVLNEYSQETISFANVKLLDLNTNQILRKKTNFNGELKLDINSNRKYKLYATAESDSNILVYQEKKLNFNTKEILGGTTIETSLKVRPKYAKKGLEKIEDINFGVFTFNLNQIAIAKLENIIEVMNKNPEVDIEVYGHASCNLSKDDANSVSAERARSAFTYLTDAGIDYTRIKAGAWGKEKAKINCNCKTEKKKQKPCTKKHHLINSRVGFVFTEKK